jgi:hypothetical protein
MGVMVVYGWWRLLRDDVYGRPEAGLTTARRVLTPDDTSWDTFDIDPVGIDAFASLTAQTADDRDPDPELADYNDYLTRLNARSERAR